MQFSITDTGLTEITHGNEVLSFPMVAPKKSPLSKSDTPMVFAELNLFINHLETRQPGVGELLFKSYQRIDQVFASYHDDIRGRVIEEIEYIYGLITMEKIQEFLQYHCQIRLPTSLKIEDPDSEMENIKEINQDMTYTYSDYQGLVRLALICRPMLPVWGRYIREYAGAPGRTMIEFDCLRLLSNTRVVQSAEFDRLVTYVEAASNKALMGRNNGVRKEVRENMIIRAMGTEESHEWILSELLVRVLTTCSLHASESVDLIRNAWNKVKQKVSKPPKSKQALVNKFRSTEMVSDDKEPSSRLDQYRTSTALSEGTISSWNYYCEGHGPNGFYDLVWTIDPTVPKDLIDLIRSQNDDIRVLAVTDFHMTILKWVQNKAISTAAIDVLNRNSVTNLITATICILIHWDFKALAFMLGGNYNTSVDTLEGIKYEEMPQELVLQLDQIYRYPLPKVGSKNAKPRNQAVVSIKRVVEHILGQRWVNAWYADIPLGHTLDRHKRLITPPNVREMLAHLIIRLTQKT